MKQYQKLLTHVLENGVRKENRTGVDTLSTFGYYYEHDFKEGFPLLTTKRISWKNIVIELLWFLSGSSEYEFLERHGCKFWRPWYKKDGTVQFSYGQAWRRYEYLGYYESDSGLSYNDGPCTRWNDQISWAIRRLKDNPYDRGIVISAWQPQISQSSPFNTEYHGPCHTMFIFNVQNVIENNQVVQKLCLHLTQRSADVVLGLPYNLASYSLLLSIFSKLTGIEIGTFGHSLVDAHIYTSKSDGSMNEYDHVPGVKEQLQRIPFELPKLVISDDIKTLSDIEKLLDESVTTDEIMSKFILENYTHHPSIKFKVAV